MKFFSVLALCLFAATVVHSDPISGILTITGNNGIMETLNLSFDAQWIFPNVNPSPELELTNLSVTSSGPLGDFFSTETVFEAPNYFEFHNAGGDEIDLLMTMPDMLLAATNDTADLQFYSDIYQCATTVCAQDFVPPGFPSDQLLPAFGTFVRTVPEIDPSSGTSALALVAGAVLIIRGRGRVRPSESGGKTP